MADSERLAELRFGSHAEQLRQVRSVVREAVAAEDCCSKDDINFIVLAVDEACSNIIKHAYGQEITGDIILEILTQNQQLVFRLTDFAAPVDQTTIRARPLDELRPGGLGVHFINEVMDEVRFLEPPEGVGNVLEMRKSITATGA